ncbi:mitochondrial intermembrane space import and assembly protein 40 protein [Paramyrothecium foliicola]|nr:mitochondrial intermembrane space import and assembly protein 40 protein [Paramyrothecium foliicola]
MRAQTGLGHYVITWLPAWLPVELSHMNQEIGKQTVIPSPRYTQASAFTHHIHVSSPPCPYEADVIDSFSLAVSYADVAASGPKQSPEEVIPNESASTASLVDVDMPSVHTVNSDFLDQDVQTDTQAERRDREAAAAEAKRQQEREERDRQSKKEAAKAKARRADNWLTNQIAQLSDGSASALVIANLTAVVGLSSYLGYRAWGLYDKGRLTWGNVGVGAAILGGVGLFEAAFGNYLYKGKKDKSS